MTGATGVKVTSTWQLAFRASVEVQLLVSAKSSAFGPVLVTLVSNRGNGQQTEKPDSDTTSGFVS